MSAPPPPQAAPVPGVKRRSSLESTASIVISGPAARATDVKQEADVIEILPQFELYDAASVIVECPKHHKFAFRKIGSKKELWYPTAVVSRINGFEASIRSKLKQLLSHPDLDTGFIPFAPLEEVQYARIQCPVVNLFVTRILFKTTLTCSENQPCCEDTVSMEWYTPDQISELYVHKFWGPEPLLLTAKKDAVTPILKDAYVELSVRDWSKMTVNDESITKAAGYELADISRIYADFLQHVYPSLLMTSESLTQYLIKSGMIETEFNMPVRIQEVFWPVSEHRLCLTFSQLVAGLAQIDADNTKTPGKKGNRSFVKCAASNDRMVHPVICDRFSEISSLTRAVPDKCPKCMGPIHMVANFSCSLMADGTLTDFIEQSLADNVPIPVFERDLQYNLTDDRWCANIMIQWIYDHAFVTRIHSGPIDLPNVKRRRDPKPVTLWSIRKDELFEMIIRLCEMVRIMLMKDSRVVDQMDPCYVIGSLHGSLRHLLQFDCLFWRQGIPFQAGNYVFLGNFSGPVGQSLECLLYLFAAKCSAPSKMALIRGKAENRSAFVPIVQQQLVQHFGPRGNKLVDSICSVFDVMPIACLVNGWEVCTTGGLPDSLHSLDEMNHIPLSITETNTDPIAKAAVNPAVVSPDLVTRMKNIHINSLITGTSTAITSSVFSPLFPVYHLSSMKDPLVVLFSGEKKTSIEVKGINPVTVNKIQ